MSHLGVPNNISLALWVVDRFQLLVGMIFFQADKGLQLIAVFFVCFQNESSNDKVYSQVAIKYRIIFVITYIIWSFLVHNLDFITSIFVIGITVVLIKIYKSESFACAKEKRERTYFPIFSICAKEKRGVRYFPIFSRIVTLITGIGFYRRVCTFYPRE